MFAFGCSIIKPDVYECGARPGIERARESDSAVMVYAAAGSIARSYNLFLDHAARLDGLEGLVLLHEDAELLDRDFCARLRASLRNPDVAVVGCVGARGVNDIAWWEGEVTWHSAPYHHREMGGGVAPWRVSPDATPGEVDSIYGVIIVLSPWAIANLRFDESIGLLHGYEFDICRQARDAGKKVVTADLNVAHHHVLDVVPQVEIWATAHAKAADVWDRSLDGQPDEAWKQRARRAEADAAASRLLAASRQLQLEASVWRYERELRKMTATRSWRITEPLRRANWLLAQLRSRRESARD